MWVSHFVLEEVFRIELQGTKQQWRCPVWNETVEEILKVKVDSVRTMKCKGKKKRLGKYEGRRSDWKKLRRSENQKQILTTRAWFPLCGVALETTENTEINFLISRRCWKTKKTSEASFFLFRTNVRVIQMHIVVRRQVTTPWKAPQAMGFLSFGISRKVKNLLISVPSVYSNEVGG